jgi:hypothetical protein
VGFGCCRRAQPLPRRNKVLALTTASLSPSPHATADSLSPSLCTTAASLSPRPHHMPLLPHARPHHCCLTIAASLCILTTAVSLLAPDSDGEETKEHNNSLGEPAYLHMSRDTLLRFYNKHSCSHCWSDIAALVLLLAHVLSYCWCHIAALILLLSYVTCCIHTTHTVD